jgi:putative PIN family toxin of toxin-antitoxin system
VRVVLDANVLVSAAIRTGASHRVVNAWRTEQAFELLVCPRLLEEVRAVLMRPRLRRWIEPASAEQYVEMIELLADLTADPEPITEQITRDADDDYLVMLARTHDADYIVTGDKDLLEWAGQHPPVVSPSAFEELLAG